MMTNVLIIGGAGFIGSHLVDVCLKRNCRIWVYDNFSTGRQKFLPTASTVHVVEGDILDTKYLSDTITACSPDTLYHLAAIHHIPTCEKMPDRALRVNIEGTQSVLSACAKHHIPRIIFASTGALYDPINIGPLAETSPVKAHDIYSISKLTGERLVEYHVDQNDGQAVIARLFNTVGRRETNMHVIPAIMAQLAAGGRQLKLGNLNPRRDYVHVEDVAQALFILGNMTIDTPFDIFNIGSGREYSVRELIELCSEIVSEPLETVSDPGLQRKVDRPSQLADLSKIQRTSGWKPERTLKQALSEVWEEGLENRDAHKHAAV